jgi:hypothetical protein
LRPSSRYKILAPDPVEAEQRVPERVADLLQGYYICSRPADEGV